MNESLFVRGGELLGGDGNLARADLLIDDGAIVEIGAGVEAPSEVEVLDLSGMIVTPGLINAHTHSGENFNPGLYENLPLDLWFLHSRQVTRDAPPSADAIYTRTLLGAVLMLQSGTTSCVDFLFEAPEITVDTLEPVVRAYRDAGLRATILLGAADKPFTASLPLDGREAIDDMEVPPPTLDRIMSVAAEAVERWHEPHGSIGIGLGPSAPQRCTPDLLEATATFARERDVVWQTHVLETKTQALTCREWHGQTFIEWMRDRDLLGPRVGLAHTVWINDDDIATMGETGTTSIHCLLSNLRLGDGVAPLPALKRAGVRVALGTDGRGCDETLDMLELTRMVALLHKARGGDWREWPTARDALEMATVNGSICTGHGEKLGRIEPGARADLIAIPKRSPAFTPINDPLRQLVYGTAGRDVDTVIVDGRVVVRGKEVVGVDVDQLLARVPEHAAEVLAGDRVTEIDDLERAVDEMYLRNERAGIGINSYLPS